MFVVSVTLLVRGHGTLPTSHNHVFNGNCVKSPAVLVISRLQDYGTTMTDTFIRHSLFANQTCHVLGTRA